jgi:intein-encoded DNA endonuclease-like protein
MHNKQHREETKKLISLKLRCKYLQGWKPRVGKRHTEETKRKISIKLKGKFAGQNNPFFGKQHSEETKKLLSQLKRGQYLIHLNLNMSEDLAYILGVLKGDGCVYLHGRGADIKLVCKHREFAISFYNALSRIGLNPKLYIDNGYHKVEASSKAFYNWYKKLTLSDIEMLLQNEKYIIAFIRGFYESEGNYYEPEHCIHIYNTDKGLIELCQRFLQKLGFDFHIYTKKKNGHSNKPLYVLYKKKKSEVQHFFELIKPCIKSPSFTFSVGVVIVK